VELDRSIKQLRDENRKQFDRELHIPDYHEKVETIRNMVEIEMSGQDPDLIKGDALLKKLMNLETRANAAAQREGPYDD